MGVGAIGNNPEAWVRQGMILAGVGEEWFKPLMWLAEHESNFNPKARNSTPVWYSKQHGYQHATGLFQTMPPTFEAYAVKGFNDIYNPVHNTAAAINYIKSKYGHINDVVENWYKRGGY